MRFYKAEGIEACGDEGFDKAEPLPGAGASAGMCHPPERLRASRQQRLHSSHLGRAEATSPSLSQPAEMFAFSPRKTNKGEGKRFIAI